MFQWFANPKVSLAAKIEESLWKILQFVLIVIFAACAVAAAFAVFVAVPDCLFGMVGHAVCIQ